MDIVLSSHEVRIMGCLIEKEVTTPDQYPLSLNALTLACNQKSNRDPVMSLEEAAVQDALQQLLEKRLVMERSGHGSRVVKYQQRMAGTEFSVLDLSQQEIGILCVLMLRGAQTPGEIRTRTQRLCQFKDVAEVESVLNRLASRDDGPFVVKLPREAGRRESRFAHLLSGEVESVEPVVEKIVVSHAIEDESYEQRLDLLEAEVKALKQEVAQLKAELAAR